MDLSQRTALITGANRGIGREFARQLLSLGATVYATARRPDSVDLPGAKVLRLDLTDTPSIEEAAAAAPDVDLLINNAGISTATNLITGDLAQARHELDVHFWGTLAVTRAFAPVLVANGGGAVVNLLSALSFRTYPGSGAYAVAKAAEWQLTNSTRLELARQGTHVLAVHAAATDTDMMAGWDIPKNDPANLVRDTLDALVRGAFEVLTDPDTLALKARLSEPPETLYADFLSA